MMFKEEKEVQILEQVGIIVAKLILRKCVEQPC